MRLKSLQLFPSGQSGWKSDLLIFGEDITQIYGPNGCGKTPLVQSIAYCLGYPCLFRNDIYDRCNYAVLTVETPKGELKLKRIFSKGKDVDIEVIGSDGNNQRFYNEKEYSSFIFDMLNLEAKNLVTTNNKIGDPYLATMLPIFYLDQDDGYSAFYCPPSNFIKDQFSEMLRMLFNLPVKNSFDAKKAKIQAKEELDYLDKQVEFTARKIELAINDASNINRTAEDITSEITTLENELEQLKSSGANHDDSVNVLDRLIITHRNSINELTTEMTEITKRINSINQIVHEINTEINTLNLNEEARRVFLSFNEICSSSNCQLFSASSDAYSKNLLYLKDQIKDLERNAEIDLIKKEHLNQQKIKLEKKIHDLSDERNSTLGKSEMSALIDTISQIKNQIFYLQNLLSENTKIELLKNTHVNSIINRNKAIDKYQSFSSDRYSNPEIVRLRSELRQYFLNWLEILQTRNISRDITFKEDFTPVLGNETISQLKGSTRIRAVLAFHAALIELISGLDNSSFNFFILDTPKQHEIHNDDLDRYVKALKKLSGRSNTQIVFSTTEYHYAGDKLDYEWTPQYPGEKQKMFLASPAQ